MVTRKGRVQVDSGIRDPATRTYEAVAVTHVGPQRKQSQASNYERLARDLGQFNSSLQSAGRAFDAAAKRAEDRAKKLQKEKEAAERRKKALARAGSRKRRRGGRKGRSSSASEPPVPVVVEDTEGPDKGRITIATKDPDNYDKHRGTQTDDKVDVTEDPGAYKEVLGEENVTKSTYKGVGEAKKVVVPQVKAAWKAKQAKRQAEGYKTKYIDDDGNEAGERILTLQELRLEYAKEEKALISGIKDPHAQKAAIREHRWGLYHESNALLKAEKADRKQVAGDFVGGNVQGQAVALIQEGADPDTIVEKVSKQALADAQLLDPSFSQDDVTRSFLKGLIPQLEAGDAEAARVAVTLAQGSPDRGSGVTSLATHPKTMGAFKKVLQYANKVIAKDIAETTADIKIKEVLTAVGQHKGVPVMSSVTEEVGGQKITVSRKDMEKALASKLDRHILTDGNGHTVTEKDPAQINADFAAIYSRMPGIHSDHIAKQVGNFKIKAGEEINATDPEFIAARSMASAMLKTPGGRRVLRNHVPDYMLPYYDMEETLRRAGVDDPEARTAILNNWNVNRKGGKLEFTDKGYKKQVKDWSGKGLTSRQNEMVRQVATAKLFGKDDLTSEELETELNRVADEVRSQNPSIGGKSYPIPIDTRLTDEQFHNSVQERVNEFKVKAKELGVSIAGEVQVGRYGNSYILFDGADDTPIFNPNTGKPMRITRGMIEGPVLKAAEEARVKEEQKNLERLSNYLWQSDDDEDRRQWENNRREAWGGGVMGGFMTDLESIFFSPDFTDPIVSLREREKLLAEREAAEGITEENRKAMEAYEERMKGKNFSSKTFTGG